MQWRQWWNLYSLPLLITSIPLLRVYNWFCQNPGSSEHLSEILQWKACGILKSNIAQGKSQSTIYDGGIDVDAENNKEYEEDCENRNRNSYECRSDEDQTLWCQYSSWQGQKKLTIFWADDHHTLWCQYGSWQGQEGAGCPRWRSGNASPDDIFILQWMMRVSE